MTRREEFINKYALDVTQNTESRLDEIVQLENIENGYNEEKYISFEVVTDSIRRVNFWGEDTENIYFTKASGSNYFVMISNRKAELEILLTGKCGQYECNCTTCPYNKECNEYASLTA